MSGELKIRMVYIVSFSVGKVELEAASKLSFGLTLAMTHKDGGESCPIARVKPVLRLEEGLEVERNRDSQNQPISVMHC